MLTSRTYHPHSLCHLSPNMLSNSVLAVRLSPLKNPTRFFASKLPIECVKLRNRASSPLLCHQTSPFSSSDPTKNYDDDRFNLIYAQHREIENDQPILEPSLKGTPPFAPYFYGINKHFLFVISISFSTMYL